MPVWIAVEVLLQAAAQLHTAHVVQQDVYDGAGPATHAWDGHHLAEL